MAKKQKAVSSPINWHDCQLPPLPSGIRLKVTEASGGTLAIVDADAPVFAAFAMKEPGDEWCLCDGVRDASLVRAVLNAIEAASAFAFTWQQKTMPRINAPDGWIWEVGWSGDLALVNTDDARKQVQMPTSEIYPAYVAVVKEYEARSGNGKYTTSKSLRLALDILEARCDGNDDSEKALGLVRGYLRGENG